MKPAVLIVGLVLLQNGVLAGKDPFWWMSDPSVFSSGNSGQQLVQKQPAPPQQQQVVSQPTQQKQSKIFSPNLSIFSPNLPNASKFVIFGHCATLFLCFQAPMVAMFIQGNEKPMANTHSHLILMVSTSTAFQTR